MALRVLLALFITLAHNADASNDTCSGGFFTVLSEKRPWGGAVGSDRCVDTIKAVKSRLGILDREMERLGSTLSIYTTFTPLKECGITSSSASNGTVFNDGKRHQRIFFEVFSAMEVLKEYGYGPSLENMRKWTITGWARTSDVLRLIIAHKHGRTYIDTDVVFLDTDIRLYTQPFASAAVWADSGSAVEISNSAFCLQKGLLREMMSWQRRRIEHGDPINYFYTELGPAMFMKVLLRSSYTVRLLSQNNPKEHKREKIAQSIARYAHPFLHLTTAIRKFQGGSYESTVAAVEGALSGRRKGVKKHAAYAQNMSNTSDTVGNTTNCHNFGSIFVDSRVFNNSESVQCSTDILRLGSFLSLAAPPLRASGQHLYVYTDSDASSLKRCGISANFLDAAVAEVAIMQKKSRRHGVHIIHSYKFNELSKEMGVGAEYSSQLLPVMLSLKYGLAFIHSETVFVSRAGTKTDMFRRPYVTVHVWGEEANALEVGDTSFCLDRSLLHSLLRCREGLARCLQLELLKYRGAAQPRLLPVNKPKDLPSAMMLAETLLRDELQLLRITSDLRRENSAQSAVSLDELLKHTQSIMNHTVTLYTHSKTKKVKHPLAILTGS